MSSKFHFLSRSTNQAIGLAQFAKKFLQANQHIDISALERVKMFHTDSVVCGISALSLKTQAPTIFRNEALDHYSCTGGKKNNFKSKVFGNPQWVSLEKAVVANCSAVREWDANGTVFGYSTRFPGHQAGEFGHNDYYPVAVAAAHANPNLTGKDVIKGMLLIDEIRGRLCEVFPLHEFKIDHVVHGAVASTVVFGALMGATESQIESAIGTFISHYIPFRSIRAGRSLSYSKGASAGMSTEMAIMAMKRAQSGFIGPEDVFRNPEALFRSFVKTKSVSPFDIALCYEGKDFAVMDMHFKLGLYEHQSAGALEGLIKLIQENPEIVSESLINQMRSITISTYQLALGIIGDREKRDPKNRQSADHSMIYIISRLLRNSCKKRNILKKIISSRDEIWKQLILTPLDYSYSSLNDAMTRSIMSKVNFIHGGKQFDNLYPEGIPTKVDITYNSGKQISSGLIMFPSGHSRNRQANINDLLMNKHRTLLSYALPDEKEREKYLGLLNNIERMTNMELHEIYDCDIRYANRSIDDPDFDVKNMC